MRCPKPNLQLSFHIPLADFLCTLSMYVYLFCTLLLNIASACPSSSQTTNPADYPGLVVLGTCIGSIINASLESALSCTDWACACSCSANGGSIAKLVTNYCPDATQYIPDASSAFSSFCSSQTVSTPAPSPQQTTCPNGPSTSFTTNSTQSTSSRPRTPGSSIFTTNSASPSTTLNTTPPRCTFPS